MSAEEIKENKMLDKLIDIIMNKDSVSKPYVRGVSNALNNKIKGKITKTYIHSFN